MLNLRKIREEQKMQQKDVASKLFKTTACISSWETGKTEPGIDDLKELANLFNTSVDYLIGRTDELGQLELNSNLTPTQEKLLLLIKDLKHEEQYQALGYLEALIKNK